MRRLNPTLAGALGTYVLMLGATLPYPLLGSFVQERLAVGELAASLYVTVNLGAYVVLAPLVGRAVDRGVSARALVACGLAAQGLLLGVQPWLGSLSILLAVRFVEGAATVTAMTALHATVLSVDATPAIGPRAGSIGLGLALGVATGSAVGGLLGGWLLAAPFLAGAGLLILAAGVLPWLMAADLGQRREDGSRSVWELLRAEPRLWIPVGFSLVDRLTVGFLVTALPLTLGELHGFDEARIGIAMAVFLLAFGLGQIPAGRLSERTGRLAPIAIGSIVYGAGVLTIPHVGGWSLWGLLILSGAAGAVMFAPSLALTRDLTEASPGGGVALFHQAGSLGFALGPLGGGALVAWLGAKAGFAIAGASEALAVLALVLAALASRRWAAQNSVKTMTP